MNRTKLLVLELCLQRWPISKLIVAALDSARRRLDYINQLTERIFEQVATKVAWRSADVE